MKLYRNHRYSKDMTKIYNKLDILYFKYTRRSLTTKQFNLIYYVKNSDLDKLRSQLIHSYLNWLTTRNHNKHV